MLIGQHLPSSQINMSTIEMLIEIQANSDHRKRKLKEQQSQTISLGQQKYMHRL